MRPRQLSPEIDADAAAAIVARTLDAAIALHLRMRSLDAGPIVRAGEVLRAALASGGKVLAFGNGGSASDTSLLTSLANDYGFEQVFARQIEALGKPGDVAVAISTSGASPNVVAGLNTARSRGLRTIALTGREGGEAGRQAEIHINVPDSCTARVQEVHITLIHAICEIVEA
jgi:phosphoheptose isomerase